MKIIDINFGATINEKQISHISHALGLSRNKKPYRNYYNTGRDLNPLWEDLVTQGLAWRRDTSSSMGGHYYHLTEKGVQIVANYPDIFGLDKRIAKNPANKIIEKYEL